MTPTQEMVMTLFTKQTIDKVKEQFKTGKEIVSNESFDMTFRLFKSKSDNINLELLIQMPLVIGQEEDIPGIGKLRKQKNVMFFKPIGFYILKNEIEITILKEFEDDFDFLMNSNQIPGNFSIHKLSLQENAVLAAFSMDSAIQAISVLKEVQQKGMLPEFRDGMIIPPTLKYDRKLKANGLKSELIMTFDGTPQFHLDDSYGLNGAIAAYISTQTGFSINPIIKYKELFDRFNIMSLMTAFKNV
ncbi:MAG: hypothetical protein A2046_08045 [Bacteroidetes bacterium GWA2_30_7]|nr:MAG: hypothetical protein A2046_08045 [Bacteroidetes bacterium GWA2_30_7]